MKSVQCTPSVYKCLFIFIFYISFHIIIVPSGSTQWSREENVRRQNVK